jgi:hypothetical protein
MPTPEEQWAWLESEMKASTADYVRPSCRVGFLRLPLLLLTAADC